MGLGVLGRGAGDAEFLVQCGAKVTVTDMKPREALGESIARLAPYDDIVYHLGGHIMSDFTESDMIIKGAGVPLDSQYIIAARDYGIPVYMSTALFAHLVRDEGVMLIGVTGTRGKSTIAHLMQHTLAHARRETKLGGNVRGVSTLAFLPGIQRGDTIVLELDSWQLQGFGDVRISPHISIISSFMPDHLNYYPDMDRYFIDKAQIFLSQKAGDFLFIDESVRDRVEALNPPVAPIIPTAISDTWEVKIPGEHNRRNLALGAAALRAAGLSVAEVKTGIETFFGVEGRLQLVRDIRGIHVYNDNNATTPEATIVALKSLAVESTVLIMGGSDKGLVMDDLIAQARRCKKVILIPGTGTERIREKMPNALRADTLKGAVTMALEIARPGDTLLFSPAFASFGLFKNEYERNDQFLTIVRAF